MIIVCTSRSVVLFLEFDLANSYLVVIDEFSWVFSSSRLTGCFEKDCYVFYWLSLSRKEIVVLPTDELFLRLVNLVDCQVDLYIGG